MLKPSEEDPAKAILSFWKAKDEIYTIRDGTYGRTLTKIRAIKTSCHPFIAFTSFRI
jgi:hypothetical protein